MITRQMSHRPQSGGVHENPELQNLTDYSPSDAPWDAHRSVSDDVEGFTCLRPNMSATGLVWPPVAVYCVSGGLPSRKPEKRV